MRTYLSLSQGLPGLTYRSSADCKYIRLHNRANSALCPLSAGTARNTFSNAAAARWGPSWTSMPSIRACAAALAAANAAKSVMDTRYRGQNSRATTKSCSGVTSAPAESHLPTAADQVEGPGLAGQRRHRKACATPPPQSPAPPPHASTSPSPTPTTSTHGPVPG